VIYYHIGGKISINERKKLLLQYGQFPFYAQKRENFYR